MLLFESIRVLASFLSIAFKLLGLPLAGQIQLISFSLLAFLYLLFGFSIFNEIPLNKLFCKSAYQHTNRKQIIGAMMTGIICSILVFGILFKIAVYPGALPLLSFGLFWGVIIIVIAGVLAYRNREEASGETKVSANLSSGSTNQQPFNFYRGILLRLLALVVLRIAAYVIPYQTMTNLFPNEEDPARFQHGSAQIDVVRNPPSWSLAYLISRINQKKGG